MTVLTATSAAGVSRVLAAEFRKSNTSSTRISGWSVTTAGFAAKQTGESVLVTYELGDWNRNSGAERRAHRTEKLEAIVAVLTSKGYSLDFNGEDVVVTGKAA